MRTLDPRKTAPHTAPVGEPVLVDVPEMAFLMIDGAGDPNASGEYREAVEALYAVAYALRFVLKRARGLDHPVMPLEGLWWADGAFDVRDRARWRWTMMIRQPEVVTGEMVREAAEQARKKRLPALPRVRLERFAEGRCAQVVHVGAYADEAPAIERLHAFIAAHGLERRGKHHEIYLSDPRRTAPRRMRTILRQGVARR